MFDEFGIDGLTVWDMKEGGEWKCVKCFKRELNEKEGHAETRIFLKSLLGKFTQQAHYKNFCFCASFSFRHLLKHFLQFKAGEAAVTLLQNRACLYFISIFCP